MDLVIDRSLWLHAEGADESRLLRPADGKMCCLGFFALACGITPEYIEDMQTPSDISSTQSLPGWLFDKDGRDSSRSIDLMEMNDDEDPAVSAEYREAYIIELFGRQGVDVTFTGNYQETT